MPGKRHKSNSSTSKSAARKHRAIAPEQHLKNVRYLTRSGKRPDPSNVRAVSRQAAELRRRQALEDHYSHKVNRRERSILKERGFFIGKRGVVVDGPRDVRRRPVKGSKFDVLKDGTVKWSVGQRRDFIYGFTAKEKKEFAKNPELFTQKILKRLREKNPTLKREKLSRIQKRLQWGAFQATKDFSPSFFTTKYLIETSPEDKRKGIRKKRIDRLTGLHFVVHIPKPSKARKRQKRKQNAKRRKRR